MASLPGHGSRALFGGLALAAVVIALAPVTKAGSAGPTVLAAYTGTSLANLTAVACNDTPTPSKPG